MSEVEQTLRRIEGNKSVKGTLVLDHTGKVIHTSLKEKDLQRYASQLNPLIERARCMVKDLDPTNELTFMRVRADKVELMIAPGEDFTLIVLQDVVLVE